MRVGICDDEIYTMEAIKDRIELLSGSLQDKQFNISLYTDGNSIINGNRREPFDIVFMDIELGDKNGIEVVRELRMENKKLQIIFISNYDSYVYDCFEVFPVAFVRKMRMDEDIPKAFMRAIKIRESLDEKMMINTGSMEVVLNCSDILYIESFKHSVIVHYSDKKVETINVPLKTIEEKMNNKGFVKSHRCYIINCRFLCGISNNKVIVGTRNDRETLSIGLKYRQAVKRAMFNYLEQIF